MTNRHDHRRKSAWQQSGAQQSRARRSGSVFVEFAFVAPILIVLVMGVVQYGMVARTTATVTNLSRVGARFGARNGGILDTQITDHIKAAAAATYVNYSDLTINITPAPNARCKGTPLVVEITYPLRKKVFLPGSQYIVESLRKPGQPAGTYTATGVMRIEVNAPACSG